jgi:polyhydroxyalkanoate synthesis regulator phasin
MHSQNYEAKMKLLNRAEAIKNSGQWNDTTAEMNELLDEWKKIGPVAREHANKIWEQFIAARKHFFARKDAYRDQRKHNVEAQKSVRTEQAKEMVSRLLREIQEEESKIADFTEALKNITPGKKAGELRSHLENLLAEGAKTLKRLKEKYDAVHAEYGKKAKDAEKAEKAKLQEANEVTAAPEVPEVTAANEETPAAE